MPDDKISIHALREEGDHRHRRGGHLRLRFQSTPSARRATDHRPDLRLRRAISIHALREEGDYIKTRNPAVFPKFQSTPSARRATPSQSRRLPRRRYFNPRPPRGGRQQLATYAPPKQVISIHALREEGDACGCLIPEDVMHFNPRPPRGGRQILAIGEGITTRISIHALREEGDTRCGCRWSRGRNFNPRPPRGGRQLSIKRNRLELYLFQSTPSARRATIFLARTHNSKLYFNPRPPRGGRRQHERKLVRKADISIHALREEGD